MIPFAVADIGNTRVKWGFCSPDGSHVVDAVSLPDDAQAWSDELARRASVGPARWVLASVRPAQCDRLAAWLRERGASVRILKKAAELPLTINVVAPDRVGIDRLLDALACLRHLKPGEPAVMIDAGSAVTVDWLDERHVFRGGTIFPGLRLMSQALHDHTALLPLVTMPRPIPDVPAGDTIPAMQAGIFHAVAGGIERIVERLVRQSKAEPRIFVTGGDGPLLCETLTTRPACTSWPWQTLEGILAAAEAMPHE